MGTSAGEVAFCTEVARPFTRSIHGLSGVLEPSFLVAPVGTTVLVIIIDSMDRKTAVWPKWDFHRRPREMDNLKPRPIMTVTGGIVHGWCTAIYVAQETLAHGSNAYVEVLRQLLDEVSRLCRAQGRRLKRPT